MKRLTLIAVILLASAAQLRGQSPAYVKFSTYPGLEVAFVKNVPIDTLGFTDVTHIKAVDCEAWGILMDSVDLPMFKEACDTAGARVRILMVSKQDPSIRKAPTDTLFDMMLVLPHKRTVDIFHIATREQTRKIISNHLKNLNKKKRTNNEEDHSHRRTFHSAEHPGRQLPERRIHNRGRHRQQPDRHTVLPALFH